MKLSDFNIKRFGQGIPMIILHGYEIDQVAMIASLEPLMGNRSIERIYMDLPGMGMSQHYESIKNADDMIGELISLVSHLVGDQAFIIAGLSYGGYLARGIVRHFRQQIKGILLIVPVVDPDFKNRRLPAHEVLYEETAFIKKLSPEVLQEARELSVVITEKGMARKAKEIFPAIERGDQIFLERYQKEGYKASYDVDEFNHTIMSPVCVIAGKQDSVVGFMDQYDLSLQYKYSHFAALNEAGHDLNYEQEAVFNQLVISWLDQVLRSR